MSLKLMYSSNFTINYAYKICILWSVAYNVLDEKLIRKMKI